MGKALKAYIKKRPSEEEVDRMFNDMLSDGPRGCVLAASSFIEDTLQGAIAHRFGHLSQSEMDELFSGTAPLATFSAKIKVAYAIGVIGKLTRHDLEIVRALRNAFAHSTRHLTFDLTEISELVASLHCLKDVTGHRYHTQIAFVQALRLMMLHLVAKMHNPPLRVKGIDHLD